MFTWENMIFGSTALMCLKNLTFYWNEVVQMHHPHIYSKTVAQYVNMLIELNVQIVPYISLRQSADLERPSDSHGIADKFDHSNYF